MRPAVRTQFTAGTDTRMNFSIKPESGSSAEIVARKNSKSYSLRRVMELKDLELGTRGGFARGGLLEKGAS